MVLVALGNPLSWYSRECHLRQSNTSTERAKATNGAVFLCSRATETGQERPVPMESEVASKLNCSWNKIPQLCVPRHGLCARNSLESRLGPNLFVLTAKTRFAPNVQKKKEYPPLSKVWVLVVTCYLYNICFHSSLQNSQNITWRPHYKRPSQCFFFNIYRFKGRQQMVQGRPGWWRSSGGGGALRRANSHCFLPAVA